MATHSESTHSKAAKSGSAKLGRSAATGRFVLAPASKSGSVSLKQAKTAIASVKTGKK